MSGKTRVSRVYLNEPLFDRATNVIHPEYEEFLHKIDGLRIRPTGFEMWGDPLITVAVRPQNHKDRVHLGHHARLPIRVYEYLTPIVFSATWPLLGDHAPDIERGLAGSLMDEACAKLMYAFSLYMPGAIRSAYAYTPAHDTASNFACFNEFPSAADFILSQGGRLSAQMELGEFLEWLKAIDGFWTGVPNTNIGRAISFLSHTHHYLFQLDSVDDFVWIMAAIEALYTTGESSVLAHLKSRIRLVLKDFGSAVSEKTLGKLYGFRSRFIHGNLSLRNRFSSSSDEEGFYAEYGGYYDLAATIAVKTVQWSAERRISTLRFREEISI